MRKLHDADATGSGIGGSGRTYFPFLNSLRGFVIAQIVFLHAFAVALANHRAFVPPQGWDMALNIVFQLLFHDATLYFAAISGLLYVQVFERRGTAAYLKSRFQNVVVPYLVIGIVLSLYVVRLPDLVVSQFDGLATMAPAVANDLAFGLARVHLWYMPVLVALFFASPLLGRIVRGQRLSWAVLALMLLPLVFSRRGTAFTFGTVLYFMGAYVAGMWIGRDPAAAVAAFRTHARSLAVAAALATLALVGLYGTGITRIAVVDVRESVYYVQKMAIFALMVVLFHRWEKRLQRLAWLNLLAAGAFGIYLLHVPLMEFTAILFNQLALAPGLGAIVLLTALCTVTGLFGSALLIKAVQLMLGRRSRYIVGC